MCINKFNMYNDINRNTTFYIHLDCLKHENLYQTQMFE